MHDKPHIVFYQDYRGVVDVAGTRVVLGPVSYAVFEALAARSRQGFPVSTDTILQQLRERNVPLSKASVKRRVSDIRRKIHAAVGEQLDVRSFLRNIPRHGYVLRADVRVW